jgi:phosphate-selective porin OprO/OprP
LFRALFCSLVALMATTPAHSQEPTADEQLRIRMDKLEKENEELRNSLKELRQALPQPGAVTPNAAVSADAPAASPPQQQVEAIVNDYLQKKESEKAASDVAKAAAAASEFKAVGADRDMKAYWRDGTVYFESTNGDFRLHVGGRFNADAAWFKPDNALKESPTGGPITPATLATLPAWQDGADFRRARLRVDGDMWEVVSFVAEVDFATGIGGLSTAPTGPQLTDYYADINQLPIVGHFRVGHFKEPFNLEDYGTQDNYITFMERSLANDAFSPNRNMGMMFYDAPFHERMTWAVGAFRSNSDNNSGSVFDYADDGYAYDARVTILPWYADNGRYVLHLGAAYSRREYDPLVASSRDRFASRPSVRVNSPFLVDTGNLQLKNVNQFNAQAALVYGSFSLQGEYYYTQAGDIYRGALVNGKIPRLEDGDFAGAYCEASYFLTGENRNYLPGIGGFGRVRVNEPFFLVRTGQNGNGGSAYGTGAWQVSFRYDWLSTISDALNGIPAITVGRTTVASAVPAVATAGIEQDVVGGLNWYLNNNLRFEWNYIHAWRTVPLPQFHGSEDTLAMRVLLEF